ncbi:MAG: glucans biosynthesis glucosyltransferase MdoH, partial [Parvularcula sp.]|nr:glucans biosynthesis glucosyltransferase MdoH [Parvularcula sp.]
WRKAFVGASALLITGLCAREMVMVLSVADLIVLEWVLLGLFVVNLAWIAFAFVSATVGLFAVLAQKRRAADGTPPSTRTVLLFPVYNEDARHVFATVEAVARQMAARAPGAFECFVLADTNRPEAALEEEAAFLALKRREPEGCPVFYRRRTINHERKSGNIADFVTRWGGRYDHMIVFDADSYMEEETLLALVARMEADPQAGLIQTIPQLVEGETLFARAQQFAAALYGPVLGAGVAWWAQNEGNFWGHNAIIRVRAFAEAAGLPILPGRAPFGGAIMSHDFIEAALLRKAGWKVVIAPELSGSYEECPPSIVELTIRDRRWCQGNLQHVGVLFRTRFMSWTNRLHLAIGVMSYAAAPLWILLILVGMALSLQAQFLRPDYFGEGVALFPRWPVIDSARAYRLFGITMAILFAPKVYGMIYAALNARWRREVGILRSFGGVLTETIISVLIAPILLAAQSGAVLSILLGRDAGWAPQRRTAGGYSLSQLFRMHLKTVLLGTTLLAAAFAISPVFAAWLSPAAIGMVLAPLLSWATGSEVAGRAFRRAGLLLTPEERTTPLSVRRSREMAEAPTVYQRPTFAALIGDAAARRNRAGIADPHWDVPEGEVYPPLAMATAKASRYGLRARSAAYFSAPERMALLNAPSSLEEACQRSDDAYIAPREHQRPPENERLH